MTWLSDAVNDTAAWLMRLSRFHLVVRGLLLVLAVVWPLLLQWLAPDWLGTGMAWLLGAAVLTAVWWPSSWAFGGGLTLLGLWVVRTAPSTPQVVALVALVWVTHRLVCWASTGPAHARVDAGTVRSLVLDALGEAGLAVALGLLVGLGWWLAGWLPRGGGWTWALLGLACVVVAAMTGRPSRGRHAR